MSKRLYEYGPLVLSRFAGPHGALHLQIGMGSEYLAGSAVEIFDALEEMVAAAQAALESVTVTVAPDGGLYLSTGGGGGGPAHPYPPLAYKSGKIDPGLTASSLPAPECYKIVQVQPSEAPAEIWTIVFDNLANYYEARQVGGWTMPCGPGSELSPKRLGGRPTREQAQATLDQYLARPYARCVCGKHQ